MTTAVRRLKIVKLHSIDPDRLDRERYWSKFTIAVRFGGGAILLLACGGLLAMLATASGESTPQEAEQWFKTVVQVNPTSFTGIQHYTDQGIDFSHHFKFRFEDVDDLTSIIKRHGLSPTQSDPLDMAQLPQWYDPFVVPADAPRFGSGPILLIIDRSAKNAYFEFVHL